MSSTHSPEPSTAAENSGSAPLFVAGTFVIAAGLGILASHAPAGMRLFVIFSLGFGLLCGWLFQQLGAYVVVPIDWRMLAVVGLATLTGLVTYVCQNAARQPVPKEPEFHPIASLVAEQLKKADQDNGQSGPPDQQPASPGVAESGPIMLNPDAVVLNPGFALPKTSSAPRSFMGRIQQYLHHRVNNRWPSPWPELLWAGEALAGVIGAVWIANRLRRQEKPS